MTSKRTGKDATNIINIVLSTSKKYKKSIALEQANKKLYESLMLLFKYLFCFNFHTVVQKIFEYTILIKFKYNF